MFLDATSYLYERPYKSVRPLVGPSVVLSSNLMIMDVKGLSRILDDGRGGKSDEEEGETRRKEGQAVRRDGKEGGMGRKEGRGE